MSLLDKRSFGDEDGYTIAVVSKRQRTNPIVTGDLRLNSVSPLLEHLAFAAALQLPHIQDSPPVATVSRPDSCQQDMSGLSVLLSGIESLEGSHHPSIQEGSGMILPPISLLFKNAGSGCGSGDVSAAQTSPSTPSSLEQSAPDSSEDLNESNEDTVPSSPTNSCDVLPVDGISLMMDKYLKAAQETVVTIRAACVAQKSYGLEKRFLCPPPALQVAGHTLMAKQLVRVSLVNEDGSRGVNQQAILDEQGRSLFKYLHVADSFKSKLFLLRFKVHSSDNTPVQTFDSRSITIISKPSKKTSKTGNNAMAIVSGAMVCFFNRVNSQTVRTKYMTVDQKRLCAKNSAWSTFEILALNTDGTVDCVGSVINYGMSVLLRNVETGVYSDVLVIKKVAKDMIVNDAQGPVSQMQKVALVSMSMPSACLSIVPTTNYGSNTPFLCYQSFVDGHDLDNHMSWTIVGIEKTQFRLSAYATHPNQMDKPLVQHIRLHAEGLDVIGQHLQFVRAMVFMLPTGHYRVRISAMTNIFTVMPPMFEADAEFESQATRTSFGSSLTINMLLELANGSLVHTGQLLVYEKVGSYRTTARVVDP